jgi:hypothetical protein
MIPDCNCKEGRRRRGVRQFVITERGGRRIPMERPKNVFFHFGCAMAASFFPFAPLNSPYLFSIPNFVVGTMAWFFLELKRPIGITK